MDLRKITKEQAKEMTIPALKHNIPALKPVPRTYLSISTKPSMTLLSNTFLKKEENQMGEGPDL